MMKHNGPIAKKMIAAALVAGSMGTFGAGAASAGHIHSMTTGNTVTLRLVRPRGPERRRERRHVAPCR